MTVSGAGILRSPLVDSNRHGACAIIDELEVRNYQSLKSVKLFLGQFTVIVGPSSSGKSALVRACRTLASNSRGSSFVTHGSTTATVSASGKGWKVTLERGGANTYRVMVDSKEESYTKLGGAVPDRVTEVLGIQPAPASGSSINFAGQFDRPYLLDDSGQMVARTLGELTNVSVIFEAAREANRLRLAASGQLKTRKADLLRLQEQARTFAGLKDQTASVVLAEELLERVQDSQLRIDRLSSLVQQAEMHSASLLDAESQLAAQELPDTATLLETHARFSRMVELAKLYMTAQAAHNAATASVTTSGQEVVATEQELEAKMQELGLCPLCGAEAAHMHLQDVV